MRRYILTTLTLLPLLFSFSHAAQSWPIVDPSPQPFGYSSEESSTGSYLGVDITDVNSERLSALKLKEEKGVEVTMVDQDAPAGKAGIKEHDVILTMNGTIVESGAQLRRMIHETPAGRVVTLGLSRDGQPLTVKVQLADRHSEFAHVGPKAQDLHIEIPPIPNLPDFDFPAMNVVVVHSFARSGLMVENITPQLGEFFGVKNGSGVLIRSVEKGSRAEKAGFRAGDVIVKVNDQPVHDTSDFMHALRSRDSKSVNVGVIRDKKEQNLNLTLPERKESGEILEEGFEPVIDADTETELSEVQGEIAKLAPQMALAPEEGRKFSKELRKSLCEQQKQASQQAEKFKKEFQPLMQEKLQKEQEKVYQEKQKLMLELERLRQESLEHRMDI